MRVLECAAIASLLIVLAASAGSCDPPEFTDLARGKEIRLYDDSKIAEDATVSITVGPWRTPVAARRERRGTEDIMVLRRHLDTDRVYVITETQGGTKTVRYTRPTRQGGLTALAKYFDVHVIPQTNNTYDFNIAMPDRSWRASPDEALSKGLRGLKVTGKWDPANDETGGHIKALGQLVWAEGKGEGRAAKMRWDARLDFGGESDLRIQDPRYLLEGLLDWTPDGCGLSCSLTGKYLSETDEVDSTWRYTAAAEYLKRVDVATLSLYAQEFHDSDLGWQHYVKAEFRYPVSDAYDAFVRFADGFDADTDSEYDNDWHVGVTTKISE